MKNIYQLIFFTCLVTDIEVATTKNTNRFFSTFRRYITPKETFAIYVIGTKNNKRERQRAIGPNAHT